MRSQPRIGALVLILLMTGAPVFGEEQASCEPPQAGFLQRLHPVGGWHPYGGGMLFWWPHHCFPCGGTPDDYCRKPLPRVCWPPYPPYYIGGPPEICHPQCSGLPNCPP